MTRARDVADRGYGLSPILVDQIDMAGRDLYANLLGFDVEAPGEYEIVLSSLRQAESVDNLLKFRFGVGGSSVVERYNYTMWIDGQVTGTTNDTFLNQNAVHMISLSSGAPYTCRIKAEIGSGGGGTYTCMTNDYATGYGFRGLSVSGMCYITEVPNSLFVYGDELGISLTSGTAKLYKMPSITP